MREGIRHYYRCSNYSNDAHRILSLPLLLAVAYCYIMRSRNLPASYFLLVASRPVIIINEKLAKLPIYLRRDISVQALLRSPCFLCM